MGTLRMAFGVDFADSGFGMTDDAGTVLEVLGEGLGGDLGGDFGETLVELAVDFGVVLPLLIDGAEPRTADEA